MGERLEQPFQLSFNGRLRVDFQGARVIKLAQGIGAQRSTAPGCERP